jgi:hypothetical protein
MIGCRNRAIRRLTKRQEIDQKMTRCEAQAEGFHHLLNKRDLLANYFLGVDAVRHLDHRPPKILAHDVRNRTRVLLRDKNLLRKFAGRHDLRRMVFRRDVLMKVGYA